MPTAKTKPFNKAAFFTKAAEMMKPKRCSIAELGGDVFVKVHTLDERIVYNKGIKDADEADTTAVAITLVTCDEAGNLLFTADDVPAIRSLPSAVTTDILYTYNVTNGIIKPVDEGEDKDIQDAKKNS